MDREMLLLDLIDRVYAAGFGEAGWERVTRPLRDALGCSVVGIHLDDPSGDQAICATVTGMDRAELEKYETYYVRVNPWLQRARPAFRTGALLRSEQFVSREALRRSEYYNDFALPNRIGRAMAVLPHCTPDWVAFFSLFRPPGASEFPHRDVELVRALAPHLQRATDMHRTFRRLREERRLAERALDALDRGAAVLDPEGRVVFFNRAMGGILEERDGVAVRERALTFTPGPGRRTFESMIAREGVQASGGVFRVPRPSLRPDYEVVVTPLPEIEEPSPILTPLEGRDGWLVLVTDPERRQDPVAVSGLRRLYGLTDAEAEVASLLAEGHTLRQIGEMRKTTVNTTKTQARRVYDKVDVADRAELVRRLETLEAAARIDSPPAVGGTRPT